MARNCSAQLRLRTRWSPPQRATLRENEVQGRKSINCANNNLPEFTAASREHLWTQHRGNFKSTPHKNNCNSPEVKGLQRVSQTLTGQQ